MDYAEFFDSRRSVFKDMRDKGELLNVVLKTDDGGECKAHIELLAGVSPYFHKMVKGAQDMTHLKTIQIPKMASSTLEDTVNCIYTNKVYVTDENLKSLVDAALMFESDVLVHLYKGYMTKMLNNQTCFKRYNYAKVCQFTDVLETVKEYILEHFEKLWDSNPEFLSLEKEDLVSFLSSDKLNVPEEELVYEALIRWVEFEPVARHKHLPELLTCVRIGLCSPRFFEEKVWTNPLVTEHEECSAILMQAEQIFSDLQNPGDHPGGQRRFDLNNPFLRPRVPNDLIFVMGGWGNGNPTSVMETYDVKSLSWFLSLNSDTVLRAYHGMIWHGGLIYVIGGFDGRQYYNGVRSFDPITHQWRDRPCMNVQRCYVSVAALDSIYVMGGNDGSRRHNTCERFDADTNMWVFIAPMHHIRSDASADAFNGKIYIAGGFNGGHVLDSAEVYDPLTDRWTLVHNMTSPRSGVKVVGFNGHVYAIGGFDGERRLETVEKLNCESRTWSEVTPMSGPRSNFATAVVNNQLYVIGGFNGRVTISTVELFDPVRNEWSPVVDLNVNRSALAACRVSGISTAHEYSFLGRF